ncbi:unnamed protein product [Camellia sinensis]
MVAAAAGIWQWNTPLPYLYGGLGVVLGVIAFCLLILLCSCKKTSQPIETQEIPVQSLADETTKIMVVMAGHDHPTYVAKPLSFNNK